MPSGIKNIEIIFRNIAIYLFMFCLSVAEFEFQNKILLIFFFAQSDTSAERCLEPYQAAAIRLMVQLYHQDLNKQ